MDPDRIRAVLGAPELEWLVARLRRRLERGSALSGTLTLTGATEAQHRAAARLLGRPTGRGASLSVRLEVLDEELQDAGVAPDLRTAVEVLGGPLEDLAGAKAGEAERRAAMIEALGRGSHAGAAWYEEWRSGMLADGTLTRLLRRGDDRVAGQAAAVLGRLPGADLPLPVLAERVTGDTKALSGTVLAGLVLRALAVRAGVPSPTAAEERRALWESAGVVPDDLSSQVLVLNLVGRENHVICDWLRDAAGFGIPFRLTLHQLATDPVTPVGPELFVCENPAVLRVAAGELGDRSAPLICTEGQPSAACHRLLAAAAICGTRIHWRGDFDWTGLRTTATAIARYAALPWRMGLADYTGELETGDSEALKGTPAPSPWDGDALSTRMQHEGRAVMEERLLATLLADLAR